MGITPVPRLLHCQTVGDWITLMQRKSIHYSQKACQLSDEQQLTLISIVLQGFAPFHISYGLFHGKIIVFHGKAEMATLADFAACNIKLDRKDNCIFCDLSPTLQKRMLQTPVPSSGCCIDSERDIQCLCEYYNKTVDAIS